MTEKYTHNILGSVFKDGELFALTQGEAQATKLCIELNALHEENQELRMDNDIKFWKHQFMSQYNENQVILHELSLAINKGYEISDKFKKWIEDSAERNKEVMEKNERLFE